LAAACNPPATKEVGALALALAGAVALEPAVVIAAAARYSASEELHGLGLLMAARF
jgi:hypothetical protein